MATGKISKGVIKDIIIVGIGVFAIWIGLQAFYGTENPFFVVSSGSMVPELEVYDVLVVQGNTPFLGFWSLPWYESFEEVKVGDVIVFNRPSGHDRVIVHRVTSIIDDDPFTIRTKGDANPASIPGTDFPITDEEYIGQVVYVIPQVGAITQILRPPVNYVIIAIIIGIMIFKQIAKSKKEKEFHVDDSLNSEEDTANQSSSKLDDLDEVPKDNAYTNFEAKENENKDESKSEAKENENKDESKSEKNNNSKDFIEKKD